MSDPVERPWESDDERAAREAHCHQEAKNEQMKVLGSGALALGLLLLIVFVLLAIVAPLL